MSLGSNIYSLRTARGMSQTDLAEALEVSRQSVSKWETDGSVPDLDKLIKLSELFGVSLDQLVKGDDPIQPEPEPEQKSEPGSEPQTPPPPQASPRSGGSRLAGIILLCFAGLAFLLFTAMGGILAGLVMAAPFLILGLICLLIRRRVGLFCIWALYFMVDSYLRYATGLSGWVVRHTLIWTPEMNYGRLAIGWAMFLVPLFLIAGTLWAYRKKRVALPGRRALLLLPGWLLLVLLMVPWTSIFQFPGSWVYLYRIMLALTDSLRLVVFTVMAVHTLGYFRWRRDQKNNP